jgi:GTP cyclohydrolase-4
MIRPSDAIGNSPSNANGVGTLHQLYIGIGSNLGDRQSNILSALQRLRSVAEVLNVSAFYESKPEGGAAGPTYLNVAAYLQTGLDEATCRSVFSWIEEQVGRPFVQKSAPRPIDIDLLHFDGSLRQAQLAERPYNAIPLYEIAPHLLPKPLRNGVTRLERSLHFAVDRQNELPSVPISLNRVGVSGVRRTFQLKMRGGTRTCSGAFAMSADLAFDKAGIHMSRFSELLEEAALDALSQTGHAMALEQIVEAIALKIVESQRALRAEISFQGEVALERWTPVSGKRTEETYAVLAIANADRSGTRRAVGVEAEGMTACPCAQSMMEEQSLRELQSIGFAESDARRAVAAIPIATHNQRGRGSIVLGLHDESDLIYPDDLIEIVEASMSSETYDLLKRPDELFVVNKAHRNPRFVEDVVRGIIAGALSMYGDFGDKTFVLAKQINYESIHKHDAFAEACGTFGEFRGELNRGFQSDRRSDLASWLGAR